MNAKEQAMVQVSIEGPAQYQIWQYKISDQDY